MTDNAPYLITELDRLSEARSAAPGDQAAEMALWEQAAKLGLWFIVNRGTEEQPVPMVLQFDNGLVAAVFSCRSRAEAEAAGGEVLGLPMPTALDWLASFGERGVTGVVLDQNTINAWIPLANLGYLKRWVPAEGHVVIGAAPAETTTVTLAPEVQTALDTYQERDDDESYDDVLRAVAGADLFVVMDPAGDGKVTHMTNERGDRSVLAFTDSARVDAIYAGKEIDLRKAEGAAILAVVCDGYDALLIDPMHPAMYVATPDRIMAVLGD